MKHILSFNNFHLFSHTIPFHQSDKIHINSISGGQLEEHLWYMCG